MKILALELSSARGSIALLDGEIKFERDWPNDRKNSGLFFENLKAVSEELGAPGLIVVGLGPGSYAGTRISISAAIGLSIGKSPSIKLRGYPSICALDCDDRDYCAI